VRSSPDGGRAWCALAAVLAVGAALAFGREPTALDWQPALALREPWRAFSAVFVHYSRCTCSPAWPARCSSARWAVRAMPASVVAWLLAWPLTRVGVLARSGLLHYGGLSGVLTRHCVRGHLVLHAAALRDRCSLLGALASRS
jgi:hypothetical protein